jgi:general secretion pathway protein I
LQLPPKGVTLVEVLVALVISALALMAGTKLFQVTTDSLFLAQHRGLALVCADNEVMRVRLDANRQQLGRTESSCSQLDQTFQLETQVVNTPHQNFRRLEVRVSQASSQAVLAERVAFLAVGF